MRETSGPRNQLRAIRTRLAMSQQELATAAGIARQTVGGIEAELYAPSAAVALRLARALGCRVEEIFWLEDDVATIDAKVASATAVSNVGSRVSLARIADTWVASPLDGHNAFRNEMLPADGVVRTMPGGAAACVELLDEAESLLRTVALAGCTPALSLWARSAERWYPGLRVQWRHANSYRALSHLADGEVHAAGLHLFDEASGSGNTEAVRNVLGNRKVALINFGVWQEGLVVGAGNPLNLQSVHDLIRRKVTVVNRELGSGSRALLDAMLSKRQIDALQIAGYSAEPVLTHQEVALAVAAGRADAGVSTEAVSATFGLGFIPLARVQYDIAVPLEFMQHEPVQQLLSTLQHRWVRSQLSMLCGYDTSRTGEVNLIGAD